MAEKLEINKYNKNTDEYLLTIYFIYNSEFYTRGKIYKRKTPKYKQICEMN